MLLLGLMELLVAFKRFFLGGDRLQPRNKEARLAYVTQALYKNSSVKQVLVFFSDLSLRICNAKKKKKFRGGGAAF